MDNSPAVDTIFFVNEKNRQFFEPSSTYRPAQASASTLVAVPVLIICILVLIQAWFSFVLDPFRTCLGAPGATTLGCLNGDFLFGTPISWALIGGIGWLTIGGIRDLWLDRAVRAGTSKIVYGQVVSSKIVTDRDPDGDGTKLVVHYRFQNQGGQLVNARKTTAYETNPQPGTPVAVLYANRWVFKPL